MKHKLCPMCGGKPEYMTEYDNVTPFECFTRGYIRCSYCGLRTDGMDVDGPDDDVYPTEEDVWTQWDRRA